MKIRTSVSQRMTILLLICLNTHFSNAQNEKMEVEGAIILSNNEDNTPAAGTIRWTGQDFEGFDGTTWKSLTWGFEELTNVIGNHGVSIPSFPGAEGHGAESIGGRGGIVVKVTNLNDSGSGSLRDALMMTVPRMIVFEVSGTIDLQSRISVGAANSFFTLAGQTAPGDGIAIRNHALDLSNVQHAIIRHLRIRHGCPPGCDVSVADNLRIFGGSNNIILDHISMTWGQDESINIWGTNIHDVTVQWSLIGEGTVFCVENGNQNLVSIFGGPDQSRITIANNYIAHSCYRNYMQIGGQYEYINCLNYNTFSFDFNFSQQTEDSVYEPMVADIIGYHFKEGPQTNTHYLFDLIRYSSAAFTTEFLPISLYFSDITATKSDGSPHALTGNGNPANFILRRAQGGTSMLPTWEKRLSPVSNKAKFAVNVVPSTDVPTKILPTVGASLPKRDIVDERIVNDFYTLGIWDAANINQYPVLNTYNVVTDTDNDGMPDNWETANGLDPLNPNDHSGDVNGDGYTNIENYINSL